MTSNIGHNNNKDYVCVDKDAEPIDNDTSDSIAALFYAVRSINETFKITRDNQIV
jgi:hypothetical protein